MTMTSLDRSQKQCTSETESQIAYAYIAQNEYHREPHPWTLHHEVKKRGFSVNLLRDVRYATEWLISRYGYGILLLVPFPDVATFGHSSNATETQWMRSDVSTSVAFDRLPLCNS